MKKRVLIPFILVMLFVSGPLLLLCSTGAAAQGDGGDVILLDRYSPDEENQTFRPGGAAVYKWLLYTDDNETRYLVVITAETTNDEFKVDISSEGEENLIVDKDSIIYVKMTVTTAEEVEDIDTQVQVSFKIIPLTQGKAVSYHSRSVTVKMETEKPEPVIEFLGIERTPPWGSEYLENRWVRFVVEVVIYLILSVVIFFLINPVIHRLTGKTKTKVDDMLVELLRWPIFLLLVIWGILQSVKALNLAPSDMATFQRVWFAIAIVIITWVAIKIFKTLSTYFGKLYSKKTKVPVDHILVPAINKIGTVIIVFFGLMFTFDKFGIDITVFLTGMGIMGLVIAFAAQDTLSNFFGGIFLIIEPKFKAGDQVLVGGSYYVVKEIGMRTTVLADKSNNQEVIVPNNKLANENIVNLMEPDMLYRVGVKASAAYGSDIEKVEKIMKEVAASNPKTIVDDDHSIYYEFADMGASSLDFLVKVWIKDVNDRWSVPHEIRTGIYKRFTEEGIEIPFNQMDVHLRSKGWNDDEVPRGKDPLDI